MRTHKWRKLASFPWLICATCGLVRLKNALTDWCVRHGCDHAEHPQYKAAVAALGGPE